MTPLLSVLTDFVRTNNDFKEAIKINFQILKSFFQFIVDNKDTIKSFAESIASIANASAKIGQNLQAGKLNSSTMMGVEALKALGLKFSTGGPVVGPGTGTSDSILARLSNGEFVVKADMAKQYGPLLEAINSGELSNQSNTEINYNYNNYGSGGGPSFLSSLFV
jgi:hypothetical protein